MGDSVAEGFRNKVPMVPMVHGRLCEKLGMWDCSGTCSVSVSQSSSDTVTESLRLELTLSSPAINSFPPCLLNHDPWCHISMFFEHLQGQRCVIVLFVPNEILRSNSCFPSDFSLLDSISHQTCASPAGKLLLQSSKPYGLAKDWLLTATHIIPRREQEVGFRQRVWIQSLLRLALHSSAHVDWDHWKLG